MKLMMVLCVAILAVILSCLIYAIVRNSKSDQNSKNDHNSKNDQNSEDVGGFVAHTLKCDNRQSLWFLKTRNLSSYDEITPVTLKLVNFSKVERGDQWNCYSNYFFARSIDYSNALFFGVTISDEDVSIAILTHFYVALYGSIKIDVLNQSCINAQSSQTYDHCDITHYSQTYVLYGRDGQVWSSDNINDTMPSKVVINEPTFIPLKLLRRRYLMNDSIYFRISYRSIPIAGYSDAVATHKVDYLLTTYMYFMALCSVHIFFL